MRIHTNRWELWERPIAEALAAEQAAGRIAPHVTLKRLTKHGSRRHMAAFEIQLSAAQPGDGRRAGDSGSYGAMRPGQGGYAATFDEWGWLLAALFAIDPDLVVGSPSAPTYDGRADFDERTGLTYNPAELIAWLHADADDDVPDPYPFILSRTNKVGRRGVGRASVEAAYAWSYHDAQTAYIKWLCNPAARTGNDRVRFAPRTVEQVRAFAHLAAEEVPA